MRKYRDDHDLNAALFAQSVGISESAVRGIIREDSSRFNHYHCRKCRGVSIRRDALHDRFVELLEALRPRREYLALFRATVLDVWKARALDGARHEEIDVEGLLGFAEYVLTNAAWLWMESDRRTEAATSAWRSFSRRAAFEGRAIWNRRNLYGFYEVRRNRRIQIQEWRPRAN